MRRFPASAPVEAAWQTVAWNGIYFQAPAKWQVAKIGTHFLALHQDRQPVLDIQWGAVSSTFDAGNYLSQINVQPAALYNEGRSAGLLTQRCGLPSAWEQALAAFQVTAFSWWEVGFGGKGLLIYCPRCQTASMLRFYHSQSSRFKQTVALRLLTSFADHREDECHLWSLYDIQARLPRPWTINQFRFQPNRYELVFSYWQQQLVLYRWGGALVRRQEATLSQFAQEQVKFPWQDAYTIVHYTNQSGEWQFIPTEEPSASRLLDYIKPAFKSFYWLRLWRSPNARRLLGVCASGYQPFDPGFLNMVCADFITI